MAVVVAAVNSFLWLGSVGAAIVWSIGGLLMLRIAWTGRVRPMRQRGSPHSIS